MVKESVIDLCNKISGTTRGARNEVRPELPEYRIVEPIVTDEMAEIALCLEHDKLQSAEEVDKVLYQLALYGVISLAPKDGVDQYKLEIWVPGVMEFMVANKERKCKFDAISLVRRFDSAVMPTLSEQKVAIMKNAMERFKRIAMKKAQQVQKETATTLSKDW